MVVGKNERKDAKLILDLGDEKITNDLSIKILGGRSPQITK